jgi:hypothetical protein
MSVNLPMYVAGLGLVVLSLVGLLALLRSRRRAPEPVSVADRLDELAPEPELPAVDLHTDAPTDDVHPDVRALRAQVRVLEEALQRAADAMVEQPELGAYRAQVRVAIESVARRTAGTDPRQVAARVAAAVARLEADPAARVTLPATPRRPVAVAPVAPARPVEPVPPLVRAAVAPVPPVADDEVVLPVPPPAPAEPRRARRRLRGSAA